jgi:tetratricopeptide (TPR) repeat protein
MGTRPHISQSEIDALIARAVDAQMHHRVSDAIECYRKLLAAGVVRPEVKFNLGLLYFETMRYDDAIKFLSETVSDKNFELASHYALGQCFRGQGKMDAAVEHFLQVVKIVDLGSVRREQADELISVYEGLAESYAAKGDRDQAESFSKALEEFLTSKGWEDKVREVRHHLETLHAEGAQISLAEVIEVPDSDKVLEALALSQEYMRRGKFGAASEECLRAIGLAPAYLPAHARLAEILVKQERLQDANTKYQTLAEWCIARNDLARAENFYHSASKIAPNDVGNRSKLIDLLIQRGRNDEALEQYLILGDDYVGTGQWARAIERFSEGVRLATRAGNTGASAIALRHRLAETRARQGDFKGALATYQEIRQQSPDDERAHFYVVDLEFRLGQSSAALRDLEDLLKRYQTPGEPQKTTAVLEALMQNYSSEPGLALRLAQHYGATGAQDKAIATLDALGELQLSTGQKRAAAATIRQIIAMNPPRVEEYKKLLQETSE